MNILIGLVVSGLGFALSEAEAAAETKVLWEAFGENVTTASLATEQVERLEAAFDEEIRNAAEALGPLTTLRAKVVRSAMGNFFEQQYPKGMMATPLAQDAAIHSFAQLMHYALVSPIYAFEDRAACLEQYDAMLAEAIKLAGLDAKESRKLYMRTKSFLINPHEPAFKRVLSDSERAIFTEQLRAISRSPHAASDDANHHLVGDIQLVLFNAFASATDAPVEEGLAVSGEGDVPDISDDFFATMETVATNLHALQRAMMATHGNEQP